MKTMTKKAADLREIYAVMFEIPGKKGHWTEPCGRFRTKFAATTWAGKRSHTVVLSLLEPGEATRYSNDRTLAGLSRDVDAGLGGAK